MRKPQRTTSRIALAAAVALVLTGCLQDPNAGRAIGVGGGLGEPEPGDGVVTLLGAFGGDEERLFNESLKPFTEETGIKVQYNSDQDFTTTIQARTQAGDLPDIGLFPQPGGVHNMASHGHAIPIDEFLDYDSLDSTLVPGFLDSARYKGRVYAVPMRMAVKSVVWYPKVAFEENGWNTAPENLDELHALATQIREETGSSPWCIGWGSDQATGWVGTDWIEEYMLRMWGPKVYDDWIYHRIPFNDERVVQAIEAYGELANEPGMVLGGSQGIINTPFGDAMNPAFQDPPGCYMMRQGNFAAGFFPKHILEKVDEEVGIFIFPRDAEGWDGQPILGGGDLAAAFSYDEDTVALMKYLSSDEFGAAWAKGGGWLSPHTTFDQSNYPDDLTRQIADLAVNADVFRYDGSDVMPREVGSGSFWTEMVLYQEGSKTAQEIADAIEASWPAEGE